MTGVILLVPHGIQTHKTQKAPKTILSVSPWNPSELAAELVAITAQSNDAVKQIENMMK